jgi:hypothetical protein
MRRSDMTKRRQKISEAVRAELINDLNKLGKTDREKEVKRFNTLCDKLKKEAPRRKPRK